MLEGLVTWFLNNYLGSYLENVDTHQLSVSLLQGEVDLENVPLRKDALRFIEPCVEVKSGVVGHIKLTIPVSRLRSEPWILLLENVSVVLTPQKFKDYDEESDDQVQVETKLHALDGIESEWRASHETADSSYYPAYSSWLNYGESYIDTIIENLQLHIRNVHVRYEDDISVPGQISAAGFTLKSLVAQTCDGTWSPRFVHRDPAQGEMEAFKIVELVDMSAYLDINTSPWDIKEEFNNTDKSREYILEPVSAAATLKRHCLPKPLNSRKQARLVGNLELNSISLQLSNSQYQKCIGCGRSLQMLKRARKLWRWRPNLSVSENPRRWWRFAITCTLDSIHKQREKQTLSSVMSAARDNVAYVEAFMHHLEFPEALPDNLKVIKDYQDTWRSYDELKALREIAVVRLKRKLGEATPKHVSSPLQPEGGATTPVEGGEGGEGGPSVLQHWFPGWYGQTVDSSDKVAEKLEIIKDNSEGTHGRSHKDNSEGTPGRSHKEDSEGPRGKSHKDVIFSHLAVNLQEATLRLLNTSVGDKHLSGDPSTLLECSFREVKLEHESRPRTGSQMVGLTVGSVHLRDRVTQGTLFPLLVAPQSSLEAPLYFKTSHNRFTDFAKSISNYLPSSFVGTGGEETKEPLLDLLYETKPFASIADYRIHVRSQPLDIVLNPAVIRTVQEFFRIPDELNQSSMLGDRIKAAAFNRLQEAKQRTREELTRNVNQLLEGGAFDKKVWDVVLDLSAPKLLIPDDFTDKSAPLVVIDFGKFHLSNQLGAASKSLDSKTKRRGSTLCRTDEDEEEEDEFVTPASTPPEPETESVAELDLTSLVQEAGPDLENCQALLHQKMYDRFTVEFNHMQIIVAKVKDNWVSAHSKGVSSLHVVDRFSISLELERRTLETIDPAWPSVVISGNLPRLQIHFNEEKLQTIKHFLERLIGPELTGKGTTSRKTSRLNTVDALTKDNLQSMTAGDAGRDAVDADTVDADDAEPLALFQSWCPKEGVDVESRLLLAQFLVSDLSIDIQSQGKPVAELQLTNLKAGITRKPFDISFLLSVQSLLLVDALQSLGPDYELLVASHRHVTVDSVSGSLKGSEPVSPGSPGSPGPLIIPSPNHLDISRALGALRETSPRTLSSPPPDLQGSSSPLPANQSPRLGSSARTGGTGGGRSALHLDASDPNALITVEVMLVSPNCPTLEEAEHLKIVNIQFNSLDVIANQETIIELIGFCRRVFPDSDLSRQDSFQDSLADSLNPTADEVGGETQVDEISMRVEVTAEFSRLNLLLLRAGTGRRIGTALLTDARVQASMAADVSASGSLGGLQILNLLSSSPVHQRILSVGREPLTEEVTVHDNIYQTNQDQEMKHAFTFTIQQNSTDAGSPNRTVSSPSPTTSSSDSSTLLESPKKQAAPNFRLYSNFTSPLQQRNIVKISLHMSSVVYTNSSPFLQELNSCAADFKRCMANLAHSITQAATEMALGIVQKRVQQGVGDTPVKPHEWGVAPPAPTPRLTTEQDDHLELIVSAVLETPVVVFPRNEASLEVLVAHLGQISISNSKLSGRSIALDPGLPPDAGEVDRFSVNVNNINLNSLSILSKLEPRSTHTLEDQINLMTAAKLYEVGKFGVPILHDTNLDITIDRVTRTEMVGSTSFMSGFYLESGPAQPKSLLRVVGRVVNPLKISLSRNQYHQVLETLKSPADQTAAGPQDPSPRLQPGRKEGAKEGEGTGTSTQIQGSFHLPLLSIELRRDALNADIEPGIVSLTFTDFGVHFTKTDPMASSLDISLKGLIMEDLLLPEESPHRNLMVSSGLKPDDRPAKHSGGAMSFSCPDLSSLKANGELISKSLPVNLDPKSIFGSRMPVPGGEGSKGRAPSTPPPSACSSPIPGRLRSGDNLVNITVNNLDPEHPDLGNQIEKVTRNLMVDFNSLDINFNLQTWVVILDFFGIGSGGDSYETESDDLTIVEAEVSHNTEVEILVKSLAVRFNNQHEDLFQATMLNYSSMMVLSPDIFSINGELGNFCIKDLTMYGGLYRDRFMCRGEQILKFNFNRYNQPDPQLLRDQDMHLELKMAGITYIHTQRFLTNILEFFNSFQQLQATINNARSPPRTTRTVGFKPPAFGTGRGSRCLLEVGIAAPLLVLPMSSSSPQVLLLDLQSLEIKNMFRFAGDEGTISATKLSNLRSGELGGRRSRVHSGSASSQRSSKRSRSRRSNRSLGRGMSSDEEYWPPVKVTPPHKCLLDVMHINLKSLDLIVGHRISAFISEEDKLDSDVGIGSCRLRREEKPLLKDSCQLKLQVERNLDKGFSHNVPDISIKGLLSKVHAVVDGPQYEMIRGFLAYNLGEPVDSNPGQEELFGGQPLDQDQLWTTMFMDIELQNVSVDLVNSHANPPTSLESPLARVNFIKSRLVYESFSDASKDVDLVSQEILLLDTRFTDFPANKRANVYASILQPMHMEERTSLLQAEIHFRSTPDVDRFTILLNNMRLMMVLDWWILLLNFISRNADNPSGPAQTGQPTSQKKQVTRNVELYGEPLYPTAGVVTRRYPVIETTGPVFELKLNITDSEVVMVSDPSRWESSAVILRSTTVLAFRPAMKERPLSCNLNNAEVFSCLLGREEETALSILDPVTVNIEIWGRGDANPPSKGLLDISEDSDTERVAEIQLQQLNIRLSYHDAIMFKHILDSLPNQARDAMAGSSSTNQTQEDDQEPANVRVQLDQLAALGFHRSDCQQALRETGGLDEAALWLTQKAVPLASRSGPPGDQGRKSDLFFEDSSISFGTVQVKTSCVNLVIIDDCKDADCPLIELSLSNLQLKQQRAGDGDMEATLFSSYYNRELSAWEPCMERWNCSVDWNNRMPGSMRGNSRLSLTVRSEDIVNINITSAMLELYKVVRENWAGDLDSSVDLDNKFELAQSSSQYRRRVPFVPYALQNNTGCTLWYLTKVVNTDSKYSSKSSGEGKENHDYDYEKTWKQVKDGETVSFAFQSRSKLRHENTHKADTHLVIIRVDGWRESKPVSVDKVGTFFRNVSAVRTTESLTEIPPARLVFQIALEGSARKLITVRSALQIENKLNVPLRIRLENTALRVSDVKELEVLPGDQKPLPLLYCWANIKARPVISNSHQWEFSTNWIHWCHILQSSENTLEMHESRHKVNQKAQPYRFCVAVRRLGLPPESAVPISTSSKAWIQPAHLVTFLPPMTLVNLLPCTLQYNLQGESISGSVSPGGSTPLLVDIFSPSVLDVSIEGYPGVGSLIMQPGSISFEAKVKLSDTAGRPLYLNTKVSVQYGGSITITVYAQFWLVNKTGLPLVFRQDGEKIEAAGQYDEHELARMIVPLLFSFTNTETTPSLQARIGNGLHADGQTKWCKHVYLQSAATVRRLRISPPDKRPEWVYIVGIDIRQGRGRYNVTNIVTISPRFQLYNQSPHKIIFSQKCFATSFLDPQAEKTFLTAHPQSSLAFHWPRLDMDQLLTMKLLDVSGCQWSGGFLIERVDSFQLSIRDLQGLIRFLRVEISLVSSTFCIVITSAESFPPPFRIDNFSEVSITFHQSGVDAEYQKSMVKPHSSVPYALDAPVLPAQISITAPGASHGSYDLGGEGAGGELTYENFIYLAFTATFDSVWGEQDIVSGHELVLDVPEGSRVLLGKKSGAKRSQLWRMTSTGMLQHEGSSPPQDPKKPSDPSRILVLDISGPAVQPDDFVPLMLRRPDPRRSLTQQWRFTEDGKLCCQHSGLYVQAKDGYLGLRAGQDAVLGPEANICLKRTQSGVPVEQSLSRQRLRPGSGFLGVKIITDGPTRVVQINDLRQGKERSFVRAEEPDWRGTRRPGPILSEGGTRPKELEAKATSEMQIFLILQGGVGISLITRCPGEELMYISLLNIVIDYQSLPTAIQLDGSVQNIQIDSQVPDSPLPIVVYLSPVNKSDEGRHLPALHFGIMKIPSASKNVEILKHFIVTVKNLTINIEEELLYKLYRFLSLASADSEDDNTADVTGLEHQLSKMSSSPQLSRFYVGTLKLTLNQVKLSVQKSIKLRPDLQETKKRLGLSLITFEDATIELDRFCKSHIFETLPFLSGEIVKHYQDELISQAVLILGSTDFLGNPLGFINDVSEGFSGLVSDGNLGGLFKNVTHGAANSTAKVAGSLSYGLSKSSLTEVYDEKRLMIRKKHSDNSRQHLVAGLKGLGFGMLGGLTSLITEPFEGARTEGVSGFFAGVGHGVVGTLTKPAIGVLDFATGAASAVRDSSRSASRGVPFRVRLPRVVQGPAGTLPPFNHKEANGQAWLYLINGKNYAELFVAFEHLGEDLMIVVSSERVVIFKMVEGREKAVQSLGYSDLFTAQPVQAQEGGGVVYYLELVLRSEPVPGLAAPPTVKRPQVKCNSGLTAHHVASKINIAKYQYEERRQVVLPQQSN